MKAVFRHELSSYFTGMTGVCVRGLSPAFRGDLYHGGQFERRAVEL